MSEPDQQEPVLRASRANELNADRLLRFPNVVGTGVGYRQTHGAYGDEICVQVFVQRKYPRDELPDWAVIPQEIPDPDGGMVRVDVIDVGFVYPARLRPVPGGAGIGHESVIDASTLGGWAWDQTDDTVVLLTCNHCIANLGSAAVPGGILQPGRLDGGVSPADLIGALKRFVPIITGPAPTVVTPVDAAIGSITVGRTDNVLDIGPAIYEVRTPTLGMMVEKHGRTTAFTTNGRITSVNVQVTVNYGGPFGLIGNAFVVTSTDGAAFANRGDSGSLIFDQAQGSLNNTRPVVGMFFAVSNNGVTTFHNDINVVMPQLNLTTVCNGAIRALIEAIFGSSSAAQNGVPSRRRLDLKDAQLRRLRDRIFASAPLGRPVIDLLGTEAAELSRLLLADEEAFGLAVRALSRFFELPTNLDILDAELNAETIADFSRLADRVSEAVPRLQPRLELLRSVVTRNEGSRIGEILQQELPKTQ